MPGRPEADAMIETISELALDIAAHCPDCADKATRLASLVRQLGASRLDRGAIQDTLDSEVLDTEMSDLKARSTADAIHRATREEG